MAVRFRIFKSTQDLELFLNGGLSSSESPGTDFNALVGKTLIFTSPSATTVTFTASANTEKKRVDPNILTPAEVIAQIKAAIPALDARWDGKTLSIVESTPASGVVITGAGTANSILGFPSQTTTGRVFNQMTGNAAPVQPYKVGLYYNACNNTYVLETRE